MKVALFCLCMVLGGFLLIRIPIPAVSEFISLVRTVAGFVLQLGALGIYTFYFNRFINT